MPLTVGILRYCGCILDFCIVPVFKVLNQLISYNFLSSISIYVSFWNSNSKASVMLTLFLVLLVFIWIPIVKKGFSSCSFSPPGSKGRVHSWFGWTVFLSKATSDASRHDIEVGNASVDFSVTSPSLIIPPPNQVCHYFSCLVNSVVSRMHVCTKTKSWICIWVITVSLKVLGLCSTFCTCPAKFYVYVLPPLRLLLASQNYQLVALEISGIEIFWYLVVWTCITQLGMPII